MLATLKELAAKLEEMEKNCVVQFRLVFDAIRQHVTPPANSKREMDFHTIPEPHQPNPTHQDLSHGSMNDC